MNKTEITVNDEAIYQLFKEETILNGYFHLVQKSLHGEGKYVGVKDMHIKYAEHMNIPIMIHYCPEFKDGNSIYKATYRDQISVMIIHPKDFYNLKFNSVAYKRDKDGHTIIDENGTPIVNKFKRKFKSRIEWIDEHFTEYEVWHYPWRPDYIPHYGIVDKSSNIDDLKIN